jgi:hypothetical protein
MIKNARETEEMNMEAKDIEEARVFTKAKFRETKTIEEIRMKNNLELLENVKKKKKKWKWRIFTVFEFLLGAELVRKQGPGLRPLRRHEWDKRDVRPWL